jgi:hypothetical protein
MLPEVPAGPASGALVPASGEDVVDSDEWRRLQRRLGELYQDAQPVSMWLLQVHGKVAGALVAASELERRPDAPASASPGAAMVAQPLAAAAAAALRCGPQLEVACKVRPMAAAAAALPWGRQRARRSLRCIAAGGGAASPPAYLRGGEGGR